MRRWRKGEFRGWDDGLKEKVKRPCDRVFLSSSSTALLFWLLIIPSSLPMISKNDLGISISVYHRRVDCLAMDSRNRHHPPPLPRRSLFVCRIYSLRSHSLNVKDSATTIPLQPPSLSSADSLLDCDHDEQRSGTPKVAEALPLTRLGQQAIFC